MRRIRWVAVLAGAMLLLPSLVPSSIAEPDAPGSGSQAFDAGVERIYESCKQEQFESARRKLDTLLRKHARKPYAIARRAELEDLAERIAFGVSYRAPKVGDVVSGRVEKWDCDKGYLHIRYSPQTDHDLVRAKGGFTIFPARVTGPFLLEVVGRDYPDRPNQAPRMMFGGAVCPRSKRPQSWLVVFGTPKRETGSRVEWMPARILHLDGKREREMVKLDEIPGKAGTRFKVQLKVTKDRITVGINGKTMFNRRRAPATYGQVGFDVDDWDKVTFAGQIEPSWIQDRLDQLEQQKLDRFRKRYKRSGHLPNWLFEGPDPSARTAPPKRRSLPIEVGGRLTTAARRAVSAVERERWRDLDRAVDTLEEGGAPPAVLAYLRAHLSAATGQLTAALDQVEASLGEAPDFLDGLLLKARVQGRLGRTDAAFETYRKAVAHHGQDVLAYEEAAIAMLFAARPDAAREVTEWAVTGGVASPNLERVARMIVKARRGPTWNQTYEYRSRHYQVMSNISKDTCKEAAKLLEEALTSYKVNLEWVSRDKTRLYPVYLFNGKQGFLEYMGEFAAVFGSVPDQVAGLYSPLLKQLVIWHVPDRDVMLEVVRHEGFHQYLDRLMPDPPIWFNEGLAVYHEKAVKKRGTLKFGIPHQPYLEVLKRTPLVPLEEFLYWGRAEFYAAAPHSYAQAWALMHLLKDGRPKHRALFKELLEAFQQEPALEVIRQHFPDDAIDPLETALQGHIGKLRRR